MQAKTALPSSALFIRTYLVDIVFLRPANDLICLVKKVRGSISVLIT